MEDRDPLSVKQQEALLTTLQTIASGRKIKYKSGNQRVPYHATDSQQMARQALHDNGLTWPEAPEELPRGAVSA